MNQGVSTETKQQINIFSNTTNYFLITSALLAAAIYRFYGLNRFSLWADELWGVLACSRGSWVAMMQDLIANDNHPPGYQTILYFVMQWFGDTETIIRLPSVVAGIATVYAVYHMGRKLLSMEAGILAALIVSFSYQSIFYSQEARAYALLTLFCTLNTYYFLKIFVVQKIDNQTVLLFTVTGVLCAFLHYAGLLFIVCELLMAAGIIVLSEDKKSRLIAAGYAYGLLILLYIKWIPVMIAQLHHDEFYWEETPNIFSMYRTIKYLLGPDEARFIFESTAIALALWVFGKELYKYKKGISQEHQIIGCIFLIIFLPLVAVFAESLMFSSIYTNRYFIFFIPLTSLLGAYGVSKMLGRLETKKLRQTGLIIVILFICFTSLIFNRSLYVDSFGKQDFRGAVKAVTDDPDFMATKGIIIASHEFFNYYLKKSDIGRGAQGYLLFESQLSGIREKIKRLMVKEFYYLEVSTTEKTDINKSLDSYYHRIDYRRLMEINVIKYRVDRN